MCRYSHPHTVIRSCNITSIGHNFIRVERLSERECYFNPPYQYGGSVPIEQRVVNFLALCVDHNWYKIGLHDVAVSHSGYQHCRHYRCSTVADHQYLVGVFLCRRNKVTASRQSQQQDCDKSHGRSMMLASLLSSVLTQLHTSQPCSALCCCRP